MADMPNRASIAVMERLGMRWDHDAHLRDEQDDFQASVYVINVDEWRAQRGAPKRPGGA